MLRVQQTHTREVFNHSGNDFDFHPDAACTPAPSGTASTEIHAVVAASAAACRQRCEEAGEQCTAAQFQSARLRCVLHRECLQRTSLSGSIVMHRHGPSWPASPAAVTWRHNASLVVVHYGHSLRWLQTLPFGLLDVVVYHKHDFGKPDAKPRLQWAHVEALLRSRFVCNGANHLFEPPKAWTEPGAPCPQKCRCAPRPERRSELAYFTTLPNYGLAWRKPRGGSREPFAYLQFILDFWNHLPPVVVFSQDDCLDRTCVWARSLPHLTAALLRWSDAWPDEAMHATPLSCFCRVMVERNYEPKKYYWYPLMSFVQSRLLNATLATRSTTVHWPMDANMAVSRQAIRANAFSFYEALHHLTTVESRCFGAGTIEWAHAFERLWMEFYDPAVPKVLKPHLPYGKCLVHEAASTDNHIRQLRQKRLQTNAASRLGRPR